MVAHALQHELHALGSWKVVGHGRPRSRRENQCQQLSHSAHRVTSVIGPCIWLTQLDARSLLAQYLALVVHDGDVVIREHLSDLVTTAVQRLLDHCAPGVFALAHSHRYAEIKTNTRL